MEVLLWIGIPVLVLALLAVGVYLALRRFYKIAFARAAEPQLDINMLGAPWTPYLDQIQTGMAWVNSHFDERVDITAFDGLKLHAGVILRENARGTALLFHGYRSRGCLDFSCSAPFYHELGLNLVIVDERACGESEGDAITFGMKERRDVVSWLAWIRERFGADEAVILGGVSMGCATVLMSLGLDLPANVKGVIADCGYTSPWAELAHVLRRDYHLPPFPWMPLMNLMVRRRIGCDLHISTVDALKQNERIPVFLVHGGADDFVPTDFGRENYAACAAEKELLIVPGAGHAVSFLVDPETYRARAAAFLDRVLPGRNEE